MPSKADIRNRITDEVKGIRAGAAPSMVPDGTVAAEEEYVPRIEELGLTLTIRKRLIALGSAHVEWGKMEKEAASGKKVATDSIKVILTDNEVEAKAFYAGENRIAHYSSTRESVDKHILKQELFGMLGRKMMQADVDRILERCIKSSQSYTVRVTPPGDSDE